MRWLKQLPTLFDRRRARSGEGALVETRGIGQSVARKTESSYFGGYFAPILARAGVVSSYSQFTEEVLNQLPDNTIRDLIRRSNPIVAKALADYADSVASGFTYTADILMQEVMNSPAQRLLDDFLQRLEREQSGLETILEEFGRDMFSHGAAFGELIIDKDKKTPLRLKTLDATTAVFRQQEDPVIGEYYELGQDLGWASSLLQRRGRAQSRYARRRWRGSSGMNFVSLHNEPTVQYRPIQSEPNNPYGTPILDPAVFNVIMVAGFMSAFRSALTGHIYPNMLVTIDKQKFAQYSNNRGNAQKMEEKFNAVVQDIVKAVEELKPGGAIVQGSEVAIGGSLTGSGRMPLGSLKEIQDVLRRDLIVAVQSQPVLMGSNETVTETHATEQIKSYGRLIRRSQKTLNGMITGYFNLILELNGYPKLAEFKLNYETTAEYKDQAETFQRFRQGLLNASEDLLMFVQALDAAKASGYLSDAEAEAMWADGMETRRQLNILPEEL